MSYASRLIWAAIFITLFAGCQKPKDRITLHKVHWDRDMCERCKMVTSDRHHSVQAINPKTGKSYMFDDIGCLLLWLQEEQIEWKDQAKIWITDVRTGKWIDARVAYYDTNNVTPMAYGFAAHANKNDIKAKEEVVRFGDLTKRVIEIEKINNSQYRGAAQ